MLILEKTEDLINHKLFIDKSIGFIPTMGSLHQGHISLIESAQKNNDIVIVSIFVNPLQFLENEDFNEYPRNYHQDIQILRNINIDVLFMPNIDNIFYKDEVLLIAPKRLGSILEGFHRKSHFNGVLQIIIKLFNLIISNKSKMVNAYFGQKDIQQLILIKKMVKNLYIPINIIEIPTIRDKNNLALSSRNIYLSKDDYKKSILIPKSLKLVSKMIKNGERDINIIKNCIYETLLNIKIFYIEITNQDLKNIDYIKINNTIILISVEINGIKLIDNIFI